MSAPWGLPDEQGRYATWGLRETSRAVEQGVTKGDELLAEVLALADQFYEQGHLAEGIGEWAKAEVYRDAYADLCGIVDRVDPRPGAASGSAKPW